MLPYLLVVIIIIHLQYIIDRFIVRIFNIIMVTRPTVYPERCKAT